MASLECDPAPDPRPVVELFAHYGFRRASMRDLARALGVSRQTVYNRFRTKEAVRDWALSAFARRLLSDAIAALAWRETPTDACLRAAFMRWTGDHVPLVRAAPHGGEIMVMGVAALKDAASDPALQFHDRLAAFVRERRGLAADRADAVALTLLAASKGVLMSVNTTEAYAAAMARVIEAVLAAPEAPEAPLSP